MNLVSNGTGLFHLISSLFALLLGTCVLVANKGTRMHKGIGYAYVISMIVLNVTAFSIYRLFHGFGPFHVAAVVSSLTLLLGMVPAILRKPVNRWRGLHVGFMYYSVIGLYAAFISEVLVRIPRLPFGSMVFIATTFTMIAGALVFRKKIKTWIPNTIPKQSKENTQSQKSI